MANSHVFPEAEKVSLPVPAGTRAISPVRIGVLNVITITDEGAATRVIDFGAGVTMTQPSGGVGNKAGFASCSLKGSANLDVTGTVTVGQQINIKVADNTLQTAAGAGIKPFGVAMSAKPGAALGAVHVKVINNGLAADAV
jgi:hypothetical protein